MGRGRVEACCVPNCLQDWMMLYRFPIPDWESDITKEWVKRIGSPLIRTTNEDRLYTFYRVCDLHFSEHCKVPDVTRLRKGSLPTLFLPGYTGPSTLEASIIEAELKKHKPLPAIKKDLEQETPDVDEQETPDVDPLEIQPDFYSVKSGCKLRKNLLDICRVCLKPHIDDNLTKLYENTREAVEVKNMMSTILPDLDQELYPHMVICESCKNLLVSSYTLREMSHKNEHTLTEIIREEKYSTFKDEFKKKHLIIIEHVPATILDHCYSKTEEQEPTEDGTEDSLPLLSLKERLTARSKLVGDGPYLCERCGAEYKTFVLFKRHLSSHELGNVWSGICEMCGKMFRTPSGLRKHIRIHSRKNPGVWNCDNCSKIFRNFHGLQIHRKKMHKALYKVAPKVLKRVVLRAS